MDVLITQTVTTITGSLPAATDRFLCFHALIVGDSSLTQCEITVHLGIAKVIVQKILKNLLQMTCVCSH